MVFLLSDVAPDRFFIIANRTSTIAFGPKVQARHPFLAQQLSMDPYRTLPFQISDYMRYTILGWNAQAEVNVIRHRFPCLQFHPFLLAQLSNYRAHFGSQLAVKYFSTIFRDKHDMVFAIPFDMVLTFPLLHCFLLSCGASLQKSLKPLSLELSNRFGSLRLRRRFYAIIKENRLCADGLFRTNPKTIQCSRL